MRGKHGAKAERRRELKALNDRAESAERRADRAEKSLEEYQERMQKTIKVQRRLLRQVRIEAAERVANHFQEVVQEAERFRRERDEALRKMRVMERKARRTTGR